MMNTHPAPGCSTMARGSSRPPDTSTVGARPDRSDTEMVSDPEESRILETYKCFIPDDFQAVS